MRREAFASLLAATGLILSGCMSCSGTVSPTAVVNGITLVSIPGGTFMMGSEDGSDHERPVVQVRISSFEIGATEITQAQWRSVMGSDPSYFRGDDLPVEMVSWNDAMEFCRRLSETTGNRFDLPTETEWEYACRAGSTSRYSGGDSERDLLRVAWYAGEDCDSTQPVGLKAANGFGLHDMHGNVWEWCRDRYGSYVGGDVVDPRGPTSGSYRVVRGGSWFSVAGSCRSSVRDYHSPDSRYFHLGFRVVRR